MLIGGNSKGINGCSRFDKKSIPFTAILTYVWGEMGFTGFKIPTHAKKK